MSVLRPKRARTTTSIASGHYLPKISLNLPLRALVAKSAPTYFSVDVAPPTRSSALRSELGCIDIIGDSVFAIGTRACTPAHGRGPHHVASLAQIPETPSFSRIRAARALELKKKRSLC